MKLNGSFLSVLGLFLWAVAIQSVSAQSWQQQVDSDIRVTLDDEAHRLHGDIQITYHNNSPETLDFVWMHLWPNAYRNGKTAMAKQHYRDGDMFMFYAMSRDLGGIDSLAFTSAGQTLAWEPHPEHIDIAKVTLPAPLAPGESVEIATPFRVDLPSGSISRLGHVGESYQITQWYPKPAVYDEDGWHPMPYLSQGEFFSEYGTFDVRITLPSNYTVGATGDFVPGSENNNTELKRLAQLVEETETWVTKEGWNDATNDFPASSEDMKTLHFRQSQVHDFAWFADKRYKVLQGEVTLPGDGREVTTWAMFTPEEGELWQKAPEYLHDATYYYSLWNGDYPYNQVTAVDGTISAGGGMEYPNVTVIGRSGSDSGLETVIVHEVGHNWFYGILGSNERENAWMDEGINSFNETRYLVTKYGEDKDISLLLDAESNLAQRFELDDFQYKWIDELSYLFPARFGADQPIQCHSNSLTQLNYGAIVYKKTAAAFAMLQSHLGTERFDAAMQLYFDTWKFRHPSPKDLQVSMEKSTGEDLSWFFEDWIQTTKRNDLKLVSVNAKSSGPATFRGIKVRNVGELSSSARVSGLVGDSVVAVVDLPLMAPGEVGEAPTPQVDVDRWVLDHDRVTLDYDRSNNVRHTRMLGGVEPLQLRMLTRLENPEKTHVFWAPALGWNAHNGLMGGVVLHNLMLPPRDFTYQWTPLLSTSSEGVDFGGILRLDWRKKDWHVGIRSSQFRAEEALQFRPEVTTGNYNGELLTRTSWEVERTLNANPVSDWKGYVRYEGVHLFGFVDPALDAVYTFIPNSGGALATPFFSSGGANRPNLDRHARPSPNRLPHARHRGHGRLQVDGCGDHDRTPSVRGECRAREAHVRGRLVAPRLHPSSGRSGTHLVHRCPGFSRVEQRGALHHWIVVQRPKPWRAGLWHGTGRHRRALRPVGRSVVAQPRRRHARRGRWMDRTPSGPRPRWIALGHGGSHGTVVGARRVPPRHRRGSLCRRSRRLGRRPRQRGRGKPDRRLQRGGRGVRAAGAA